MAPGALRVGLVRTYCVFLPFWFFKLVSQGCNHRCRRHHCYMACSGGVVLHYVCCNVASSSVLDLPRPGLSPYVRHQPPSVHVCASPIWSCRLLMYAVYAQCVGRGASQRCFGTDLATLMLLLPGLAHSLRIATRSALAAARACASAASAPA